MKRICAILVALLMFLAAGSALAEEIDVTGFWYSEEDGDGIELLEGTALFNDADGEITLEGTYTADGANVTIEAPDTLIKGTVSENTLTVEGTGRIYVRDGIEVGYWFNEQDEAMELSNGEIWIYDANDEVTAEGTYTVTGNHITIEVDDKVMHGEISDFEMTIDGVLYLLS